MSTLALIGLVGGLITGIAPCILPVLPVVFFSGHQRATTKIRTDTLRPYLVIAGLVASFSVVTLVGSALLSLLHLPQDTIRWVALVALVAIGLGLIFPNVEELLEKPFARLPQKQIATRSDGFGLGLCTPITSKPASRYVRYQSTTSYYPDGPKRPMPHRLPHSPGRPI
jgi:cytochrome c biogenesis protein CcdA